LNTAKLSLKAIEIAETVVKYGNPNSISDAGVSAQAAFAGVKGGIYNVLINLRDIEDDRFNNDMRQQCEALEKEARKRLDKIDKQVEGMIK